jgi:DNA-binding MurR/RpiR family transcriptional regulator
VAERATASVVGATTTLERATPSLAKAPSAALSLVRLHYAQLPGALQRVAETVLLDPPAAAAGTIVELAERSGTSVSTVTRFCRAIGFEGFAGLRLGLRKEEMQGAR